MFKRMRAFLKSDIWNTPLESLTGLKKAGVRFLKILRFSFRKLTQDQLLLRAPALAFLSLTAVVPLAALVFGVAKGFGLQDILQKQLRDHLALPGEAEGMILDFAQTTLQQARAGLVAGLGFIFLFISVTLVLSSIEGSFNRIWGIRRGRSLSVKIRDYFSMIFVGTILLLISLSLTVAITNIPSVFGYLNRTVSFLLSLVPYTIVWFLFAFLIVFMPNRKVSLRAGLFAGVVSGTLYQLFLNFYIRLQVMVAAYNAIYGSFAALPLFLLWLQISWICLLFGAEISYSYENAETVGFAGDLTKISIRAQKTILLYIVHQIVRHFKDIGKPSPSADQLARDLGLSGQLVAHLLEDLVDIGLITETLDKDQDRKGYQPGVPPETLTVSKLLKTIEERGISDISVKDKSNLHRIEEILNESDQLLKESSFNVKIEDLI